MRGGIEGGKERSEVGGPTIRKRGIESRKAKRAGWGRKIDEIVREGRDFLKLCSRNAIFFQLGHPNRPPRAEIVGFTHDFDALALSAIVSKIVSKLL